MLLVPQYFYCTQPTHPEDHIKNARAVKPQPNLNQRNSTLKILLDILHVY